MHSRWSALQRHAARLGRPSWNALLDVLAPRECAACGEAVSGGTFCGACGGVRAAEPGSVAGIPLWAAGVYEPPLSLAIGRFKFERHSELAGALASLLAEPLARLAPAPDDVFVPVPLHPERLVERGFDQAALLAAALARAAKARSSPRLLERVRATDQQARLGRDDRAANVRGAFRVREAVPRGRVLLVDDVVTTGATIAMCVDVLRAAGSEVSAAVALARAGA